MDSARLGLALWTCLLVSVSGRLNATEGEVCKVVNGKEWKCKTLADCQYPYEFLNDERNEPPFCSFEGPKAVVCCDPAFTVSKSNAMCKKYAEAKVKCGMEPEPLILNGIKASTKLYPHTALLGYGNSSSIKWQCGGNLISEDYVISAAHCNSKSYTPKWVKLGSSKLSSEEGEDGSVTYEIANIIAHPDYKQRSYYSDVALYKLKTPVQFTDSISPVCLQKGHELPFVFFTVVGWGRNEPGGPRNEELQHVKMTEVPWMKCNDYYKSLNSSSLKDGLKENAMICAVDYTQKDSCSVESGDPLLQPRKDIPCMYNLVGTASFSRNCGTEFPGVYSRVSYYVPWIESIVWP